MAKDKPKNGRRTKDVKATKVTRPTPTAKGKPDKEGLRKTFKTETKYGGKTVKTGTSQAAKRRALRTKGGKKLFQQRRTGTTSTWPSSKRMTYKGMSADTRSGTFPTSGFVISHEQKKRPTKAKRGR